MLYDNANASQMRGEVQDAAARTVPGSAVLGNSKHHHTVRATGTQQTAAALESDAWSTAANVLLMVIHCDLHHRHACSLQSRSSWAWGLCVPPSCAPHPLLSWAQPSQAGGQLGSWRSRHCCWGAQPVGCVCKAWVADGV